MRETDVYTHINMQMKSSIHVVHVSKRPISFVLFQFKKTHWSTRNTEYETPQAAKLQKYVYGHSSSKIRHPEKTIHGHVTDILTLKRMGISNVYHTNPIVFIVNI